MSVHLFADMGLTLASYWEDHLWQVRLSWAAVGPSGVRCAVDQVLACQRLHDDHLLSPEEVELLLVTHTTGAFNEHVRGQLATVVRWAEDQQRRKDSDDGAL